MAAGDTDFQTLEKHGDSTYTLTTKHGFKRSFSTIGLLTSVVDLNANAVTYAYTDADSDSVADELSTITDRFSRSHSFSYTTGKVTGFTDYASHATTLAQTSGQLTSVTLTDPDGGGSLAAPVWAYAYNGTTNLLATRTDPVSNATDYTYASASQRLTQIDLPGVHYTQHTSIEAIGLASGTGNAPYRTVNPQGTFTNENGKIFQYRTDRFGNTTDFGFYGVYPYPGTSIDVTDTLRDANGLPIRIERPDPGTSGRPTTKLAYNTWGDLIRQVNADATAIAWTFDSTLHRMLTATDEMSRQTVWTYNTTGNELTRTDPGGNVWTTSYTGRTDGLPTSFTTPDPDGAGSLTAYVTSQAYDSYGRPTTTTYADSTTSVLAYNSANQVSTSTNELGFVTTDG